MSVSSTTDVVRLNGLTKDYGHHRALDGIDLTISRGEVFGYLGPNGAGKTTTLRLLMGLLRPTAGGASVFGLDAWRERDEVHAHVGYLPGDPGWYDRMTGEDTLRYFAELRGRANDRQRFALSERLDLDLSRRVRTLSRGNRQKLGIVQAFMSDPELLILDEPTTGLDPIVQREVHRLLREATERGATVLLSSHVLAEVQQVADRVGIIRNGRLVTIERLEELRAKALHRMEARLLPPIDRSLFDAVPDLLELAIGDDVVRCAVAERSLDALVKALSRCSVIDLAISEPDLEEMFLTFYAERRDVDA